MRITFALTLLILCVVASSCSDAPSTVTGERPLLTSSGGVDTGDSGGGGSPCSSTTGTPKWSDLYQCYFGVTGVASCGGVGCHGSMGDSGAQSSGFVCGASAASCWSGVTTGILGMSPIVPPGGATDATSTMLWSALHVSDPAGATSDNMPLGGYTFTAADLIRIRAWIQGGAPNN